MAYQETDAKVFEILQEKSKDCLLVREEFQWVKSELSNLDSDQICNAIMSNPAIYREGLINEYESETAPLDIYETSRKVKRQVEIIERMGIQPELESHSKLLEIVISSLHKQLNDDRQMATVSYEIKEAVSMYNEGCLTTSEKLTEIENLIESTPERIFAQANIFHNQNWNASKRSKEAYQNSTHFAQIAELVTILGKQTIPNIIVSQIVGNHISNRKLTFEGELKIPIIMGVLPPDLRAYVQAKLGKKRSQLKILEPNDILLTENQSQLDTVIRLMEQLDDFDETTDPLEPPKEEEEEEVECSADSNDDEEDQNEEKLDNNNAENGDAPSTRKEKVIHDRETMDQRIESESRLSQNIGEMGRSERREWEEREAQRQIIKIESQTVRSPSESTESESGIDELLFTNFNQEIETYISQAFHQLFREHRDKGNRPNIPKHKARFNRKSEIPESIEQSEIREDDFLVKLNESERSLRFIITQSNNNKRLIANQVHSYRWDRIS